MSTTRPRSEAAGERSPKAARAQTAPPAPRIRLEPSQPSGEPSALTVPYGPARRRAVFPPQTSWPLSAMNCANRWRPSGA